MENRTTCITILLTICISVCYAQSPVADSSTYHTALTNITNQFTETIGNQSGLYNGPEYEPYNSLIQGTAYFNSSNWQPATITYNNVTYTQVPVKYDMTRDLVVMQLFDHNTMYSLISPRVKDFYLAGHHFVYADQDGVARPVISPGFFDEAYNGSISILVKKQKYLQNVTNTETADSKFLDKTDYYLKKGNDYYPISSTNSLINALKDHKPELDKYVKNNRAGLKENKEQAFVQIAAFYDHLTN